MIAEHIEQTPGIAGGKPRIKGHRITVQNVAIWHERMGWSVDEIASEYDLSLGAVYAALSYYCDHRAEIDAQIREGEAFVAAQRALARSKTPRRREHAASRSHSGPDERRNRAAVRARALASL